MANIVESSNAPYAPVSNVTGVYFVDANTGIHKAKITGVNIAIGASNVPVTNYNITFDNPQLGSRVTPVTSLYASSADAWTAYQLLIT